MIRAVERMFLDPLCAPKKNLPSQPVPDWLAGKIRSLERKNADLFSEFCQLFLVRTKSDLLNEFWRGLPSISRLFLGFFEF